MTKDACAHCICHVSSFESVWGQKCRVSVCQLFRSLVDFCCCVLVNLSVMLILPIIESVALSHFGLIRIFPFSLDIEYLFISFATHFGAVITLHLLMFWFRQFHWCLGSVSE